jgi:PST family polysaccharide transporter
MGDRWIPAIFMMQMLASVYALQTLGTMSQALAMAAGETKVLFIRDLQSFMLRIPLLIVGMLAGGVVGIVYARVASGIITIYFNMRIVHKVSGLPPSKQLSACWRTLSSALAMAGTVGLVRQSATASHALTDLVGQVALAVSVGSLTYVGAHLTLWVLSGSPDGPEVKMLKGASILLQWRRRRAAPIPRD